MLQSIEHQSGLPIAFDPVSGAIHWPEGTAPADIRVRTFHDMQDALMQPSAAPTEESIYTVHRNVARRDDAERIREKNIRYDITVIPAGYFPGTRREFFRTLGHYHPLPPANLLAYPEVYEVIAGRAYWLIQRPGGDDPGTLQDIYLIEAGPGEKAIMPPGFGHITVNAGSAPLITANWIADGFEYDYGPYKKFRGGGYWILEGDMPGTIEFMPNSSYAALPELAKLRPREIPAFGLVRSKPLYSLAGELEKLNFLSNPDAYADLLGVDKCYQPIVP